MEKRKGRNTFLGPIGILLLNVLSCFHYLPLHIILVLNFGTTSPGLIACISNRLDSSIMTFGKHILLLLLLNRKTVLRNIILYELFKFQKIYPFQTYFEGDIELS